MGNWMPAQDPDSRDYIAEGSVEVVGANLAGAKYTLAVPAYLLRCRPARFRRHPAVRPAAEACHLRNRAGQRRQSPGADDDQDQPVRSRRLQARGIERARHAGAGRARLCSAPAHRVPRLGAASDEYALRDALPHRRRFELRTQLRRRDHLHQHARRLFAGMPERRAPAEESQVLAARRKRAHGGHPGPASCNRKRRRRSGSRRIPMRSRRGSQACRLSMAGPRCRRLRSSPQHARRAGFEPWVTGHKIPLGRAIATGIEFIKAHGSAFFAGVSFAIHGAIDSVNWLLSATPAPLLILLVAALAWLLHRSIGLVVFVIAALLFIMNQGYWAATLETLSLVFVSALVSTLLGVPIGIAAAHRPAAECGTAPGARPDADPADFRLPHPDAGAVRARRGSGPDLNGDLRVAGADSPDAARHLIGADARCSKRAKPSARHRCSGSGRSSCRAPSHRSSPASPNASC